MPNVCQKFILVLVLALSLTWTTTAQQPQENIQRSANASKVLLYVDESPVTQAQLNAKRSIVIEQQRTLVQQVEVSQDEIDSAALTLAVREKMLLNEAKAQGIEFADGEISQRVRSMQEDVTASGDEEAKAAFRWAIAQNGLTDAEFASDPRVIAAYRVMFTLAEIRSRIVANQVGSADTVTSEEAVEKFIQNRGAKLRIADPSISTAARTVQLRLRLE